MKRCSCNIPEEYHAEELAGKEATFKTKVNEIKFKDVPELNDEIANELDSDAENVDEYKENLRKRLSEQKATEAENTEKKKLLIKQQKMLQLIFLKQ